MRCVAIEAADACQLRRCKYVEVSATLGHRVDELLVGVAKQIQLMTRRLGSSDRQSTAAGGGGGSVTGVDDHASRSTRPPPLWSAVGPRVTVDTPAAALVRSWTHQSCNALRRQRLVRQTTVFLLRPHETLNPTTC